MLIDFKTASWIRMLKNILILWKPLEVPFIPFCGCIRIFWKFLLNKKGTINYENEIAYTQAIIKLSIVLLKIKKMTKSKLLSNWIFLILKETSGWVHNGSMTFLFLEHCLQICFRIVCKIMKISIEETYSRNIDSENNLRHPSREFANLMRRFSKFS